MLDRLYKTDYQHISGKNCRQYDPNQGIKYLERQSHYIVAVHYRTIIFGNSVVKDAIFHNLYVKDPELNVLCFEIEAIGLMNNLPCLIICRICDYYDFYKNNNWHKYATLTAITYVREVLLVLKPQYIKAILFQANQVIYEL